MECVHKIKKNDAKKISVHLRLNLSMRQSPNRLKNIIALSVDDSLLFSLDFGKMNVFITSHHRKQRYYLAIITSLPKNIKNVSAASLLAFANPLSIKTLLNIIYRHCDCS